MNLKPFATIGLMLALACIETYGQDKVACWDRLELSFKHEAQGNPFDVPLEATFTCKGTRINVEGFYDGEDTYRVRFMPTKAGTWRYTLSSPAKELDGKTGTFEAVPATGSNHGMVETDGEHAFRYADGTRYYPFGTTSYAWLHMSKEVQEETLQTLAQTGFNKIRMCVFPKSYNLVKEEPALYPFEIKGITKDKKGNEVKVWDYERFNPAYFQHLETCIGRLGQLGMEVDLILFHPYDKGRWGFDAMPEETNIRYIHYLVNRLGAFRNVWWSMANEWDYVKAKTVDDWKTLARAVVQADPYRHLCSIHGSTATYFDYGMPEFTHVSVQDEAPVFTPSAAALLRQIFHKPVICDEVGYEGNLASRWGRLNPQQMLFYITNGLMGGIYVTHGECYQEGNDPIFWAQGGKLKGESWKRIGFLRQLLEAMPNPLQMADINRDLQTSTAGDGYYFVYLGKEITDYWRFNLPAKNASYGKLGAGRKFKVDVINLWDMTVETCPTVFETGKAADYRVEDVKQRGVRLPCAPYLLLRVTEVQTAG